MYAVNVKRHSIDLVLSVLILLLIQEKNLMPVTCKHYCVVSFICILIRIQSPGCGRRFTVISNLRRHLRVHQKPHSRRRSMAQQRRAHVERLINRTNTRQSADAVYDITDCYPSPPPLSDGSLSSTNSDFSSPPRSPSPNIYLDANSYRLLKPKVEYMRPECLSIKSLLN